MTDWVSKALHRLLVVWLTYCISVSNELLTRTNDLRLGGLWKWFHCDCEIGQQVYGRRAAVKQTEEGPDGG